MSEDLNHELTIDLVGVNGEVVRKVSQIEAARLLKADAADLLLEYPPAVKLKAPPSNQRRLVGKYQHALRAPLYGNYRVEKPNGTTIFKCNNKKALWYINRGLVDIVSKDPPVLRFKFEPAGNGHVGDDFYLGQKHNKCVVCGCEKGLNRHHVVPLCYRRHFPSGVKNHSHHDVVLLCLDCHENYEKEAATLKHQIGVEHEFPFGAVMDEERNKIKNDDTLSHAITCASALHNYAAQIPAPRQQVLREQIEKWTGCPPTDEMIEHLAKKVIRRRKDGFMSHGEYVGRILDTTEKVQTFVIRWRQHFLQAMKPQHLPSGWQLGKTIFREDVAPEAGEGV